jgi:DNA polymerase III delta prime subunit
MLSTRVAPGFLSLGQATARAVAIHGGGRGRLGRTFLVFGPRGAGKGAFVEDLLALLFCTDADRAARPCNACAGCRQARERRHPDLVLGSPERWRELRGSGESLVAAARQWLGEAAGAPIAGERRVVLIEGIDRAGEQIQNALLKALEEPSDRHVFVLVADEPSRLLPTVRSRCEPLRIGPVPRGELIEWLIDREQLPRDLASALARISDGLVGRALALARDKDQIEWRRRVQAELLSLLARGRADRFSSIREMLDEATRRVPGGAADDPAPAPDEAGEAPRAPASIQRAGATALTEAWLGLARDLMMAAAGRPDVAPATELLADLPAAARRIDARQVAQTIELLERVHEGLGQNASPRLALEAAMLSWPTAQAW